MEKGEESILSEYGRMQFCKTYDWEEALWEVRQPGTGQSFILGPLSLKASERAAALTKAGWDVQTGEWLGDKKAN